MDATPPDLPPAEADRDPYDVGAGRKTLRVLLAVFLPPAIAAGAGMFAALMMAFATDGGVGDEEFAGRMFFGTLLSIGAFGLCGIPAAFAVVAPPQRRRLWWRTCFAIAGLSILGALVCMGFYVSAVMK